MMARWKLNQYVSPSGRKSIDDRRKDLPVGAPRADMDVFLKFMVKALEWEYPDIDSLKGDRFAGLTELRWKSGRVPHRIFGYKTGDFEYLMLIGCTHNGKKYSPVDAMETARTRKIQIENGEASTCEYRLITDR